MQASVYVEVGLIPDSPVQATGSFNLNDPVSGLLGTNTLGTSIVWTDISRDVNSFTVTRPASRQGQGPLWTWQGGTATIALDNSGGTYDVDNATGPFFGLLLPMVPVRVRATFANKGYGVYSGFADGWFPAEVTYAGDYAELTLSASDAFKVLAGRNLPTVTTEGTNADTGARIKDILLRAGWYTSAEKNKIDTGNSLLQGTTLGRDALSLMQQAADSEIGQLYIDGTGAVVFRARHALMADSRSNTVQAVFGDSPDTVHPAGTELAVSKINRTSDDTTIVNDVQATRDGGSSVQEVTDAASITKYLFPRTFSRSDLLLQTDGDALAWAQWVLYIGRNGENRFESITVNPLADEPNLWPQVLGRDVGDRIQVWHRPASVASPVVKDCFIAGIAHEWNSADSTWFTTWTLQDATKYGNFLTLNNSTLGALGSNALAY